jgi:hypothetical protein
VAHLVAVPLSDGGVLLASGGDDATAQVWESVLEERVPCAPGYMSDAAAGVDLLARGREAVAIVDMLTAR